MAIEKMEGALDDIRAKALAEQVSSTLLENQKEAVGQSFCFSRHDAVQGFYRYKDIFQLIPIPATAPHAPMIMADHPFILQFRYLACPDPAINGHRRTEKEDQDFENS